MLPNSCARLVETALGALFLSQSSSGLRFLPPELLQDAISQQSNPHKQFEMTELIAPRSFPSFIVWHR